MDLIEQQPTHTFDLVNAQNSLNQFKDIMTNLSIEESQSFIPLDVYQAEKVIQEFKKIQFPKGQRKSFIEIMGLNHLESVSSKTLAFFLDSNQNHNLEDLVLGALLKLTGKQINYQLHSKDVILEKRTEKGRIDIWIETSEFIIVIENKINHHADNNPFDDYISHAQKNNPDGKELILILLTIKTPDVIPTEFHHIKHFELSQNILNGLGHKSLQADQYYLTYLIDYITAIEKLNPKSEYGKMQMDIVNFYRNNREILEKIESEDNKESVYQYYQQQLQEINDELKEQSLEIFPDDIEFNKYENCISEIGGSFNTIIVESKEYDSQLEFEIYKSTGYTNLWLRRFKGSKMKKQDSIELQEFLKKEKINFIEQDFHYDVHLLEENESISSKDFVTLATPIIKKILNLHKIN